MKNFKYILTILFFTLFTTTAFSQNNIAVLDVIKLLKESKAAISMKAVSYTHLTLPTNREV